MDGQTDGRTDGVILICHPKFLKGIKRGRQKKRWEDNIKEWTGMDFASSKQDKMERDCCEFIYGAPTTFQGYGIEENRIAFCLLVPVINEMTFNKYVLPSNFHSHITKWILIFMEIANCEK